MFYIISLKPEGAIEAHKKYYLITILLFLITFSVNNNVLAQNTTKSSSESPDSSFLKSDKKLPILNNFRFLPTDILEDPFITSYVKTSVGSGAAIDLKSYLRNFDGEVIDTISGRLSYISADLKLQLAVNDWLAFYGLYGGFGRLGNNTFTILTSGISYTTGFIIGGKVKIWSNNTMMLSGNIEYKDTDVFLYSVYDYVKDIIESGDLNDFSEKDLLAKDQIKQTFISLNYAYAPLNWFGILSVAGWGVGNAFKSKERGNARLALAATIDLERFELISIPIGVLASVKYNSFSESGENVNNLITLGFKIGYTGHKDFDIGIENTYSSYNYRFSDQKIQTLLTAIKIRYYF